MFLDYTGHASTSKSPVSGCSPSCGRRLSKALRERSSTPFPVDGVLSPPDLRPWCSLMKVITAHCYAERGLLAIDCFTCGDTDRNKSPPIHNGLMERFPILCVRKERMERFISSDQCRYVVLWMNIFAILTPERCSGRPLAG